MSTTRNIESELLPMRMRAAVALAWSLFARKVGGGVIEINNEASMQLQFSYVLQQLLPLIAFITSCRFRLAAARRRCSRHGGGVGRHEEERLSDQWKEFAAYADAA